MSTPICPAPDTAWYDASTSSRRPYSRCSGAIAMIIAMVVQFALAMMPRGRRLIASLLTSGTTSGTSCCIRNAAELSTTVTPRDTAIGAHSSDTSSGTSNMAMSTPSNASGVSSRTTIFSPRQSSSLPADRADAIKRMSPQTFLRDDNSSRMTVPTEPVAPTTASVGCAMFSPPQPCPRGPRCAPSTPSWRCLPSGAGVHDRLLGAAQLELVVHGAHRRVEIAVAAHYGDPDLGGGDHLDVDARLADAREEGRGDARVRPHAGADQRDLADVVVEEQALELDLLLDPVQGRHRGRAVGLGQGEGDVGTAGSLGRHVLHDHVDVDLGLGDRLEDAACCAGLVRHPDDGDLGFTAIVRDP